MAKKKPAAKKPAAKKPVAKKPVVKQSAAKKPVVAKKAVAKKPVVAKKAVVRRANSKSQSSFLKPLQPDATLGAVIGTDPLARTEVNKKIWEYIRKNNLQDTQNKGKINADDKLKEVFGGKKQVSMFEMTKLVISHLS
ncbi:MAG: SWIB/MDM2 domain-containing protein [Candidatus Latescibacterota bacterium]